ncbi:hypothetical protein EV189_3671 [Motilibacter rhizosphaerae]|uniref:Uncharacterized protein n=1 Tax=Motilibacter rhizosphaerae TaxID=598652 RepID=A0A4Q7NBB1_9ACTN|nr:hypothetical protein EV189_3671 [Motilibacter rhizosphaerae]
MVFPFSIKTLSDEVGLNEKSARDNRRIAIDSGWLTSLGSDTWKRERLALSIPFDKWKEFQDCPGTAEIAHGECGHWKGKSELGTLVVPPQSAPYGAPRDPWAELEYYPPSGYYGGADAGLAPY